MDEPRILKLPRVKGASGLSKSEIYRRIAAGDFPAPVRLGARAVGWHSADIANWIASRPKATRAEEAE